MASMLPATVMEAGSGYHDEDDDDSAFYESVHQWLSFKKKMFPIVATILITLSIVGTTGNALVLYVYGRKKDRLTSTFFILILAVTDFITCLVIVPFTFLVEYLHNKVYYEFPCRLYEFLITSNVPFSCFVMVAIAFDRYFCICWPLKRIMTIERARVVVLILAVFAMSLGVIPALSYGIHEDPSPYPNNETNETLFSTAFSTVKQFPITFDPTMITSSTLGFAIATNTTATIDDFQNTSTDTSAYRENYSGICMPMTNIVPDIVRDVYQAVYATFFLLSITLVSILYILLYLSVRRRRLAKMKRSKQFELATRDHVGVLTLTINAAADDDAEETDCIEVSPGQVAAGESVKERHRDSMPRTATPRSEANGLKEDEHRVFERAESMACTRRANQTFKKISAKERKANVRTAVMLFVVTLVFIITFLPAFLMAHRLVDHNPVIFYLYFAYNVANPMIYCFMNKSFRLELIKILRCQGRGRSRVI